MTSSKDGSDVSYLREVRDFDHRSLAEHPSYPRLRQALSDLANEISGKAGMTLPQWLDAVRDMALTAPYSDSCPECDAGTTYWPCAAKRDENWITGVYHCSNGHTWTCGYAVNVMDII